MELSASEGAHVRAVYELSGRREKGREEEGREKQKEGKKDGWILLLSFISGHQLIR